MGYYFFANIDTLILAVLAVFLLWRLLRTFSSGRTRIRDIVAYRYSVFRGKGKVNTFILILLVFSLLIIPSQNAFENTALLSLNYSGASQGLAPNGTRYNQSSILSDEILERAIEKGALEEVSVEDLRKTLQVEPQVEGNSQVEEEYHVSTQFVLHYEAVPETAHLDGELVTQLVLESYKEWFVEQYSIDDSFLNSDFEKFLDNDYLDICEFFSKRLEEIGDYMLSMRDENASFRLESTGDSFGAVASNAYSVRDVMVENLQAYILENGLTKDQGTYLGRLSFENVNLNFDAQRQQASNENYLEAVTRYEDDMARTVLVPTYDVNSQFYMSRTRIGVDDFASLAENSALEMTAIQNQMDHNSYEFQMLLNNTPAEAAEQRVEELIGIIMDETEALMERAETLVREYTMSQANSYMTITKNAESFTGTLVYCILFVLLAAAMIHLNLYLREANKRWGASGR